jgi:transcriptional regulator with XRE-family HTH domain
VTAYTTTMVTRIGPRKAFRLYLREWREHRGLTQDQLAQRIGKAKGQVSGWESGSRGLRQDMAADLAYALDISIDDLYRDPAAPSADDLLRDAPPEVRALAIDMIKTLLRGTSKR